MNGFITYNIIRQALAKQRSLSISEADYDPFAKKGSFDKFNRDLYLRLKDSPELQKEFADKMQTGTKSQRIKAGESFIGQSSRFVKPKEIGGALSIFLDLISSGNTDYFAIRDTLQDAHTDARKYQKDKGEEVNFGDTTKISLLTSGVFPKDIDEQLTDFTDYTISDLVKYLYEAKEDDEYRRNLRIINQFVNHDARGMIFRGSGDLIYETYYDADNDIITIYLVWTFADKPEWAERTDFIPDILTRYEPPEKIPEIPEVKTLKEKLDEAKEQMELRILKRKEEVEVTKIKISEVKEKIKFIRDEIKEINKDVQRFEDKADKYFEMGNQRRADKYYDKADEYQDKADKLQKRIDELQKEVK